MADELDSQTATSARDARHLVADMKILIAGLPKSGTTALFFKIAQSIRGPYLQLFEPVDGMAVYGRTDLAGVDLDQVTLLAKILCVPENAAQHNLCRLPDVSYGSFQHYDRKIFLIRDPRDNLISLMLYMVVNSTKLIEPTRAARFVALLREKEADPGRVAVLEILHLMSELNECDFVGVFADWLQFSVEFTETHTDYKLYRYEDLVANKFETLDTHLGFALSGTISVPSQLGRVVRTKSSGDWRNWFTAKDVDYFKPQHSAHLTLRGYTLDWTLPTNPVLAPEFGSEYVRRIINEYYETIKIDSRL